MNAVPQVALAWGVHALDWILAARRGPPIVHPGERGRELGIRLGMIALIVWSVAMTPSGQPSTLPGAALLWGGTLLAILARRRLGPAWGIGVRPQGRRVEGGPFRWVRHPIYVGTLSAVLGQCLLLRNPPSYILLGLGIGVAAVKSRLESRWLAVDRGDEGPGS